MLGHKDLPRFGGCPSKQGAVLISRFMLRLQSIPKVVVEGVVGGKTKTPSAASFSEIPSNDFPDLIREPVDEPDSEGNYPGGDKPGIIAKEASAPARSAPTKIGYSRADSSKETFEQYHEKLREEYGDLPEAFWAEQMERFRVACEENPPKNAKLFLRRWAEKARTIYLDRKRQMSAGSHRNGSRSPPNGQKLPNNDPDRFVHGQIWRSGAKVICCQMSEMSVDLGTSLALMPMSTTTSFRIVMGGEMTTTTTPDASHSWMVSGMLGSSRTMTISMSG